MSSAIIAIAGFTGRLAQNITQALLEKPNVTIHGIARNPSKVPQKIANDPRVKIFEADATPASIDKLRAAIRGASIVVCCFLGDDSIMVDGQKLLIDASIAENVPRYLASDYSFDHRGLKMNDIPFKNFQLIITGYLAEKEAQGLIKGVHVLNGAFSEVMFAPFLGIYDAEAKSLNVWGTGDEKYEMSTYEDTGRFTAEVALDPAATGFMKFVGDRVSLTEIQAIYQDVYGDELVLKSRGSPQELIEAAHAAQAAEPGNLFSWMGSFLNYYCVNGATHIDGDDRERYGLAATDLRSFFKAHEQAELATLAGF